MVKFISINKGITTTGETKAPVKRPSDNTDQVVPNKVPAMTNPETQAKAPDTVPMDTATTATTTAAGNSISHSKKGGHAATQRGVYHGTLQQDAFIRYKQEQYEHYTSTYNTYFDYKWVTEYNNRLSAMWKRDRPSFQYNDATHMQPTYTSNYGCLSSDACIANVWFPTTRYLFDDFSSYLFSKYKKCRLKWMEYNVKFVNYPIEPGTFTMSQITQNANGSAAIARSDTRILTMPAWRYQLVGLHESLPTNEVADVGFINYSTESFQQNRASQWEPLPKSDGKFYIWRDIDGKLKDSTGKPYAGLNQEKPNLQWLETEATGVTVKEARATTLHINKLQIRNKDEGFVIDDGIYCHRDLAPDKQVVMTTDQAKNLIKNNLRWDELTYLIEGLPTEDSAYTVPQNEFFNFYFVPHGDFPFMDWAKTTSVGKSEVLPIVPFYTRAYLKVKAHWEFYDREAYTTPLTITKMTSSEETDLMNKRRKYQEYLEKTHNPEESWNQVVPPHTRLEDFEQVRSILPYESKFKNMFIVSDKKMEEN